MTEPVKKTTKKATKVAADKPVAKKAPAKQPAAKKAKVTVTSPTAAAGTAPKAEVFTVALPLLPKFDLPKPHLDPLGLTKVDRSTLAHMAKFELPKVELPKFDLTHLNLPKVDLPKVPDLHLPKVDAGMVVERATHVVEDARRNVTSTVTMLRELVGR